MALDVKVTIDLLKAVGKLGFGYPLILEENATAEKAYKEYSDINEVLAEGYEATSTVYKAVQLMLMQEHKPSTFAICSTTGTADAWLRNESNVVKEWRQLIVINGGDTATDVKTIAGVVETAIDEKMYFANVDLPEDISTATAIEGIDSFGRTVLFYYTATEDYPVPVAALVGEIGGLEPGSYTVNNLVLNGLVPYDLSDLDIKAIHNLGGITFILAAGDGVCSEGKVASGEFIDIVDGNDYIKQQLEYQTQKVFNNNLKVPYTNVGIAMLESAAIGVMQDAQNKGIVDEYTVTYALREDVSVADRAARNYFGGNISYAMQGAIHYIEIRCQATV